MAEKASLATLLEEYQTIPAKVAEVNYQDQDSIKAYNKAVKRMHTLASRMSRDYDLKGARALAKLLEEVEYDTHLWVARHLLEHFDVDKEVGEKALNLMEEAAKGEGIQAIEFQTWLNKYYAQGEQNQKEDTP
ncbi:MAG TPA: hypothetical protein DCE41_32030 [Cytophagales bacterium]|nr:hypothetical protein [Cytophagales bacterium]HAA22245.1 hypothetical protein [Cytophagales bacterium]HAP63286.1 hypothetical protein [Cytophagales bacterium]